MKNVKNARQWSAALSAVLIVAALGGTACEVSQPLAGPGYKPGEGLITDAQGPFVAATTWLILAEGDDAQRTFDEQMAVMNEALETQPGLVGMSLAFNPFSPGEYRTLSVWESEEAMLDWVVGDAHGAAMDAMAELVESGRTTTWTLTREEIPPSWEDAKARLDESGVEKY